MLPPTSKRLLREARPVTTLLVTHPACAEHDMGEGHPERPERMRAVERALATEAFPALVREIAPRAAIEALMRVHPDDYIAALEQARPSEGVVQLDADTAMSPGTWEAALRSAGGAVFAIDAVVGARVDNAFVATRPPGHHAEAATPMGFCIFNNAAIAARHAQIVHGVERVAIVDFDVHHGNGTQDIFWSDRNVMYASTHQMPLYPGTGARSEAGEHDQIVNAPLRAGDGGEVFREAFNAAILPRLDAFAPDLVIVSAGFDAHFRDPLGNLNLHEADFAWVTQRLVALAHKRSGGRLVSLLEGGYDLEGLARSAAAHVGALTAG
jgi:acetoin utilization deacetylase AcuC-like enzyme